MHLLLCAEDSEAELRSELAEAFPGAPTRTGRGGWLETEFKTNAGRRLPLLAFARQWLPEARPVRAESVRGWAGELLERIAGVLSDDQPWSLHIEPHYASRTTHHIGARAWHSQRMRNDERSTLKHGLQTRKQERERRALGVHASACPPATEQTANAEAGRHRCRLIHEALVELMQRKRRHLLRRLLTGPGPFTPDASLVQLLLTTPEEGFISVASAPLPFEQRHLLSPFPKGEVPMASDQTAPSRAFAKLVEAEQRLGRGVRSGESCVDLGAAPGSWTYVAAGRGARVIAVDRSPLRDDLLADPRVEFVPGDAFRFQPKQPVDWLLCDVLAAPERTAELLLHWLQRGWCRHFVVTLKLKDAPGAVAVAKLKRELPLLTSELFLTRLCANKKEVCAFGIRNADCGMRIEAAGKLGLT